MERTIPCAGAVIVDSEQRLLLVRRAHDPGRGLWSVPGGKCLPAESAADACVREVAEETGLQVHIERHLGSVRRAAPLGAVYAIDDFLCTAASGVLAAGDDAAEVRWVATAQLDAVALVPGLLDALRQWLPALQWPAV